jgi:hypothetical protein
MWSNGSLVVFHGTDTTALSAYRPLAPGSGPTRFSGQLGRMSAGNGFRTRILHHHLPPSGEGVGEYAYEKNR